MDDSSSSNSPASLSDHLPYEISNHTLLPNGEYDYYSNLKGSERPSLRSTQGWRCYGPMTIDPCPYNVFDTPAPAKLSFRSFEKIPRSPFQKSSLSSAVVGNQSPKKQKQKQSISTAGQQSGSAPAAMAISSYNRSESSGKTGLDRTFGARKRARGTEDNDYSTRSPKKVARGIRKQSARGETGLRIPSDPMSCDGVRFGHDLS